MRVYECKMTATPPTKEFFYVGVAHPAGVRVVKIGTTNNLNRRLKEHHRHKYAEGEHALTDMQYLASIQLSHANTLHLEDCVREQFRRMAQKDEVFERNDRFILLHDEAITLRVTVKTKTYEIVIPPLDELP